MTKQDFWLPALYIVFGSFLLLRKRGKEGVQSAVFLVSSFASVALAGWSWVLMTAGWGNLVAMLHGFGSIAESGGRGFPSWERVVTQFAGVGYWGVAVLLCLVAGKTVPFRRVRVLFWSCIVLSLGCSLIYLGVATKLEKAVVPALGTLHKRAISNYWPLAAPFLITFFVFLRWRRFTDPVARNTACFLLGLCCTARLRRLFEFTEWYCFLLEVPALLYALGLFLPKDHSRRGIVYLLSLNLFVAGYGYWLLGDGRLTRSEQMRVETPRGSIWLQPREVKKLSELQSIIRQIDPSGTRPLFGFGYGGGFNYFLARENPSPLTQGFYLSNADPDAVIQKIKGHSPPVILVDNLTLENAKITSGRIRLDTWGVDRKLGPYRYTDRPFFDKLLSACEVVGDLDNGAKPHLRIWDCKEANYK